MSWLNYGMVYLGSALMVYNVYSYVRFSRRLQEKKDWGRERRILNIPIILLVFFLLGYLFIGIFGKPDLVISGILFGGSFFVFIIFALLQFITDRVQENEHLEAKLLAAEESSKTKAAILSTVSHEMRTPMNAIIGLDFIALKNPDLHPETRRQFEKIDENARHLLALIENILDMSNIDSGNVIMQHNTFSPDLLLEMVNRIMKSQCTMKGLDYHFAVSGKLEDFYVGDQGKLRQILVSILDNAVKYTESPGNVSLLVKQTGSSGKNRYMQFIISDTGIGMDPEYIPRIFNSFDREDNSATSQYRGIGLSLSVAKKLIEMMDGMIEVRSEKGVGSTFTFTVVLEASDRKGAGPADTPKPEQAHEEKKAEALTSGPDKAPAAAEPEKAAERLPSGIPEPPAEAAPAAPEERAEKPAEDGPKAGRKRVLIAEDIDINAEILADLLDMEDIDSERAENGAAALRMFSENPAYYYDAVLMDLRMPVMDGLESARRIRALERPDAASVPIIAVTANASDEDKLHVHEAGMNYHLSKPVDADVLYETLDRLMNGGDEDA